MAVKIWKIALLVSDMKKSKDLYVNKLGFKVTERMDLGEKGEVLFLDAGDVKLELISAAAFEGVEGLDRPGVHHLSFQVDDVEATTEEFRGKGISVIKEPFEPIEGMTLAFFDGFDGVNLQLFHHEKG